MIFESDRNFLFRCETCKMIVSVNFDDEEEIEKVNDDEVILECACGGESKVLRD